MSRSDDPTRTGDLLFVVLGVILILLSVAFAIGTFVILRDQRSYWLGRNAVVVLGVSLSLALLAAGWSLAKRRIEALLHPDDYEGLRWPDVTVEEERRLRLAARREKRRS